MKIKRKNKKIKETYLWDYYKDGVTQSFINKWLSCKYQAYLQYVQGWTKLKSSEAIEFGNCFHYVLDESYRTKKFNNIKESLEKYKKIWADQFQIAIPGEALEIQEKIYALIEMMFPLYFKYYQEDKKRNWHINELSFKVKYKDTFINGKFDAGYLSEKGNLWLMDNKCMSRINLNDIEAILPFDLQCNLYLLACKIKYNKMPKGIIYNIIRRPQNRLGKTETLEQFVTKIEKKIVGDLTYYFYRFKMEITKDEMDYWEKNIFEPLLNDIKKWYDNNFYPRYINTNDLINKYGRCALFNLIVRNSTEGLYKRNKLFPELI